MCLLGPVGTVAEQVLAAGKAQKYRGKGYGVFQFLGFTLLETHMETQKGPNKDYSLSKMGLYGFPC